jgi:hypothetical protein
VTKLNGYSRKSRTISEEANTVFQGRNPALLNVDVTGEGSDKSGHAKCIL